jgi:DNA invertase Pin-like site-specific DNA recombinase
MSTKKRVAISYCRFSNFEQRKGDSEERQREMFQQFCRSHDLAPDDKVYIDRGRSAFKGAHRDKGNLGVFLQALGEDCIPEGAVLVVEALDRLSRLEPVESMKLAQQVMDAGVSIGVVTLASIFTREDMSGDRYHTLSTFFWLAHQESLQKSRRVRDSWKRRRQRAREKGLLMTGVIPLWLEKANSVLRPIPQRVATVRRIYELSAQGYGDSRIVRTLIGEKITPFKKAWNRQYVSDILSDKRVTGEVAVIEGDPIPDYYPRVIDDGLFQLARNARQGRTKRRRDGTEVTMRDRKNVNVFRGLLVHARDGEGFSLKKKSTRSGGRLSLVTSSSERGRGSLVTFPYLVFEEAVLALLREIDPADVLGQNKGPTPVMILEAKLANIQSDLTQIRTSIKARYSKTLDEAAREMEDEEAKVREELDLEKAKAALPAESAWKQLPGLVEMIDREGDEARLRLRPVLRRMIDKAMVLIVRRGSWLLCAVQLFLTQDGHRDYLIAYQAAGRGRKGGWTCRSLAPELTAGLQLDLRRREHAAKLEKALLKLDL